MKAPIALVLALLATAGFEPLSEPGEDAILVIPKEENFEAAQETTKSIRAVLAEAGVNFEMTEAMEAEALREGGVRCPGLVLQWDPVQDEYSILIYVLDADLAPVAEA